MASAWVRRVTLSSGAIRYRVVCRVGGRESKRRYLGQFPTKREADARKRWADGELAALRIPDVRSLMQVVPARAPSVSEVVRAWRDGRRDVADGTLQTYDVALGRIVPRLGAVPVVELDPAVIDRFVGQLVDAKLKRETIRKTLGVLAQALEWHGVDPNPARDRRTVRLPRREYVVVSPPTADHVEAVYRLLARANRLPLLSLDGTGMRVGEVETLLWSDLDEPRSRWRVLAAVEKTRHAKWVDVPEVVFRSVCELCPREDRNPEGRVFDDFNADRFRTALGRACNAAGVPRFSPSDLRDRWISIQHAKGRHWAQIAENVGHRSKKTTADIYTHVLIDEREVDYELLLNESVHARARIVALPVAPRSAPHP